MRRPSTIKWHWAIFGLSLLGLSIMAASFTLVHFEQERNRVHNEAASRFGLLSNIVLENLRGGNYEDIAPLIDQWGQYHDDIVHIELTTANGFSLAEFRRTSDAKYLFGDERTLEFSYTGSARLKVISHIDWVYHNLRRVIFAEVSALLFITGFAAYLIFQSQARLKENLRLTQLSNQLERSNKDLEFFSYSVSHDLRSPLRAVSGFVGILEEEHASKLDEEGLRLLGIVSDNVRKMGELINDILAFSRAGRRELKQTEVDMNALVEEAWADLRGERKDDRYRFHHTDLPPVYGDVHVLHQVWQNLLSNAIKFSRERDPAVIEVTAEEEENQIRYSVRDNGAGFNPDYTDQLFIMFQRLHSMDEFEGTGVGLAIVKRFIQKHGGDIKATGVEDEGATFSFTLPDSASRVKQ